MSSANFFISYPLPQIELLRLGPFIAWFAAVGPCNRVLVVDDEPAIRALIAKIVQRAGFAVETARDGAEAVEKLREGGYSVLVVDLMMPVMDGYDVVRHVREVGLHNLAIIVITAGDTSAIRRLDPRLVHSVVRKPFDIDVLGDLIVAAAQSMRMEDEKEKDNLLDFPQTGHVC
jgi:CheY-like chemotaxis protein